MANKTNSELIQELAVLTAKLDQQVVTAREEIKLLREHREVANATAMSLERTVAKLDQQITGISAELKEATTRKWTVIAASIAAIAGAFIGSLLNFGISKFFTK